MLSSSTAPENIVRSVHRSIAKRILAQMASLVWEPPIVFTGGSFKPRYSKMFQ